MKKKQIIGLVVAAALFVGVSAASVFTNTISKNLLQSSADDIINLGGSYQFNPPSEDYIAIVRVEGTIQEQGGSSALEASSGYQHDSTMNYIDELMDDSNNKGILLYVDSPGGTVYESEELYQKLKEYKETTKRPIWDYMAHYAASGGYMVSMASDKIYANSNTTTGSIGVIMSGYDMSGLYKKLGIRYVSITSGKNKDSSKFTDEQIAIYQDQINEAYEEFVNIVADGRDMSVEDVKKLADGRTYTAKQAKNNGLIDEISLYPDMKDAMSKKLGTSTFYEMESDEGLLQSLFSKAESLVPKSEAQVLTETAKSVESGVPMYYAEQLRESGEVSQTEQLLCQWESGVCRVLGADGGLYDRQCGSICRPPDRAADICRYLTGWRRCDNGNGYPVSLFVERYRTVCSESVVFYCIYLSDRNDTWKESDESPGSFKKSGREADTVQCGVPRDGWKILM